MRVIGSIIRHCPAGLRPPNSAKDRRSRYCRWAIGADVVDDAGFEPNAIGHAHDVGCFCGAQGELGGDQVRVSCDPEISRNAAKRMQTGVKLLRRDGFADQLSHCVPEPPQGRRVKADRGQQDWSDDARRLGEIVRNKITSACSFYAGRERL
jgi:hypothetical protein